jgi:hypothetical protein
MAKPPPLPERVQKDWQGIEQNQTDGRGCPVRGRAHFDDFGGKAAGRCGSNQPKPRVGCRQTAQSVPRGCQSRRRSSAVMGMMEAMGHAALRSGLAALSIS